MQSNPESPQTKENTLANEQKLAWWRALLKSRLLQRVEVCLLLPLTCYVLTVGVMAASEDESALESVSGLVFKGKEFHNQKTEEAVLESLQAPNSDQLRALKPKALYQLLQKVTDSLFSGESKYSEQDAVSIILAFMQHPDTPNFMRQNIESNGRPEDEFIIISGTVSVKSGVVDFYLGNQFYFRFTPPRVARPIGFDETSISSPDEVFDFFQDPENEPINYQVQIKQAKSELVPVTSPEVQRIQNILSQHDLTINFSNQVWIAQTTTTTVLSESFGDDVVSTEYVIVDQVDADNRVQITRRFNPSLEGQETSYQLGSSNFGAVSSDEVQTMFEQADLLWQRSSD